MAESKSGNNSSQSDNKINKPDNKINKRFKAIYNNIKQGIALHELIYEDNKAIDYKIIDVNPAYEDILGISFEEAVGSLGSKIYESEKAPFLERYARVAKTGNSIEFEEYFKPMDKYFSITVTSPEKGKFITLFSDITKRKKREEKIKEQKEELYATNEQLRAYNEEITAMNEELEESFDQLNQLNKRFIDMIELVANMEDKTLLNEKEFFSELLDRAIEIVPEADYGKICIIDSDDNCNIIYTVGHNLKMLKEIKIDKEKLISLENEEVYETEEYFVDFNKLSAEEKEIFNTALQPIKDSLSINIMTENKVVGRLILDIKKDSDKDFSKITKKILKSFANLASSFFAFKRFNSLKTNFTKELITSIINIMEMYDIYTKGHSENVARVASAVAREMELPKKIVKDTYWAGLVHDIGKLLIPIDVLNKKTKLTAEEYELIQEHPIYGKKALASSESLEHIAEYVLHHHENWDGSGYPKGLEANEIPLISQILGVADAWDAMLSKRAYRDPLSRDEAIKEIKTNKGTQFSPKVVEAFLEIIEKDKSQNIRTGFGDSNLVFEENSDKVNNNLSFEKLFKESKEGIVIVNKEFNIIKTNNYFKEMFGYNQSELTGVHIKKVVPENKYTETNKFIKKVKNGEEVNATTYRQKKSGDYIEVSIQAFPLSNNDDSIIGYYIIYRDINEF